MNLLLDLIPLMLKDNFITFCNGDVILHSLYKLDMCLWAKVRAEKESATTHSYFCCLEKKLECSCQWVLDLCGSFFKRVLYHLVRVVIRKSEVQFFFSLITGMSSQINNNEKTNNGKKPNGSRQEDFKRKVVSVVPKHR